MHCKRLIRLICILKYSPNPQSLLANPDPEIHTSPSLDSKSKSLSLQLHLSSIHRSPELVTKEQLCQSQITHYIVCLFWMNVLWKQKLLFIQTIEMGPYRIDSLYKFKITNTLWVANEILQYWKFNLHSTHTCSLLNTVFLHFNLKKL